MKVLGIISDRTVPVITGVRVRNHWLWPAVQSAGVEVRLVGTNLDRNDTHPKGPDGVSIEFFSHPRKGRLYRAWKSATRSFHQWPHSMEIQKRVQDIVDEWQPDIVHAEEIQTARYLPCMNGKTVASKQTVTFHNVESDLLKKTGSSPYTLGRPLIEALHRASLDRYEKQIVNSADLCFAYSELDRKRYLELFPEGNWAATLNGTAARQIEPAEQTSKKEILIVGSLNYAPNMRGLFWFLNEVLPHLDPEISVVVAGSKATPEVRARLAEAERVDFADSPESLDPYFKRAAICVVPVFEGSGTRGKILEALAQERVVITSRVGAEGLHLGGQEVGIYLEEDAPGFIKVIHRLCAEPQLRASAAKEGRNRVLQTYDWQIVADRLIEKWKALTL